MLGVVELVQAVLGEAQELLRGRRWTPLCYVIVYCIMLGYMMLHYIVKYAMYVILHDYSTLDNSMLC